MEVFQTMVSYLGKLAIFMICARMIVLFRPGEHYEKYLKFIMSVLILLQFLTPIQQIILGKELEFQQYFAYFDDHDPLNQTSQNRQMLEAWEMGAEKEINVQVDDVTEILVEEIIAGGMDEP